MPEINKVDSTDDVMPFDEDLDEDIDEELDEDIEGELEEEPEDNDEEDDDEDEEDEDDEESENSEGSKEKKSSKSTGLDENEPAKEKSTYMCPRCKRIYQDGKWVKDSVTELYTVKTELAFCDKDLGKSYEDYIGVVEIYDQKLAENKEAFIEEAQFVEREIEDIEKFENIISIKEKNGVLFIFTNTTRMALEIGKKMRQEFMGAVQYEWFERNQYLRIRWFDALENRDKYRKQMKELKEFRFGFPFED